MNKIEILKESINRDNAILIGVYEKLNNSTIINFKCNCGNELTKVLKNIISNGGAFCKSCTDIRPKEKSRKSNIDKYGVEYTSQIQDVKNKVKNTVLEKYGVDNISKLDYIKKKIESTNIDKYGTKCSAMNNIIRAKREKTNLERYNTIYPSTNSRDRISIEKLKKKNIEKYGVPCVLQSKNVKEKTKQTNLKRYGTEYSQQSSLIKDKIKNTNLKRYGVEYLLQSPEIRKKLKENNMEKYGVEHTAQVKEIQAKAEKNSKRFKDYIMPSGDIRRIQGYEHFALNILVTSYTEEQIQTSRKDVPRIEYIYNNNKKYYFPDIYIPHINTIIEVKSDYTYKIKPHIIKLKGDSCKLQGYNYEIWVFNSKGVKLNT